VRLERLREGGESGEQEEEREGSACVGVASHCWLDGWGADWFVGISVCGGAVICKGNYPRG
jgi:hypothetical protein